MNVCEPPAQYGFVSPDTVNPDRVRPARVKPARVTLMKLNFCQIYGNRCCANVGYIQLHGFAGGYELS